MFDWNGFVWLRQLFHDATFTRDSYINRHIHRCPYRNAHGASYPQHPTPPRCPFPIPTPQGRAELSYRTLSLAIDDQYIYWLVSSEDRIVRQSLQSFNSGQAVKPETFATTRYPNGRLDLLPMQRNGDWLYFVDCNTSGIPTVWMVRAINVNTGTEKIVAQSQGTSILYDFKADHERVAMILSDWGPNKMCPGAEVIDIVLAIAQLGTGKHEELDRECFDQPEWLNVALSGEYLFATRAGANQSHIGGCPV